jgi:hypothetical protein
MADDFSPQIAALTAGVPIVLLPVRIETRWFNSGNELRIRIFPDQIHADAHEPELTTAERDAGMVYWKAVFASPDPKKRKTTPWANLCAIVGAPRAAWIVRALTPTNIAALATAKTPTFPAVTLRTSEWGRAARATLLPKRWLVVGAAEDPDFLGSQLVIQQYEMFRKWSNEISPALDLTVAPDSAPTGDATALPLQPNARWLVDFDEAERVGMAVRITVADCKPSNTLSRGFKRLHVFGVDWTQTPDASAAALKQLMYSHIYTDGLSAIAPGTPTNVTANGRAGAPPTKDAWMAALDPEQHPTAAVVKDSAADRLWRDLGIVPTSDDLLTAYPGANVSDQKVTSELINALWEGTLGAFAVDIMPSLVNDATLADVRDHAHRYLQPGGHYSALRIGRQPYGVLPIVGGRTSATGDTPIETLLLRWLSKLEGLWRSAVTDRVPRLSRSSNVEADLASLLQRSPVSETYQYRAVVERVTATSVAALQLTPFANAQDWTNSLLWQYLGSSAPTAPMSNYTVHPSSTRLGLPLVDPNPGAPGSLLSSNYLQSIADLARSDGTYDAIKSREAGASVLESLIARAAARELHRADMRTINNYLLATHFISALPPIGVLQVSPMFGGGSPAPVFGTSVNLVNASQAARVVIPTVTGTRTVRQFVTAAIARGAVIPADYSAVASMLSSVEWLATQPADQIERCLRNVLDGFSFRLDAWLTSLASRRLATARATKPTGVYVGAYGWVDDVHPSTIPTSLGYIHAPSLVQATTSAVLRSGHLAHNDAEHQAFDVNLNSDRVRTALQILDAVAQGQPLAAILGYQFERSVRSASLLLAQYILPFRRLVPLRSAGDQASNPTAPATPSDNISARDVVDGVSLVVRWQNEGVKLLSALVPAPSAADQAALGAVLDALAGTYDAIADVMIAEAVHQNVLGNGERSGAVLAALDRQETPPRMDFVKTPRTGKSFTHRVLVLIGDESLPPAWTTLDVRANAEPRLNAWVARLLGDPTRVAFAARVSSGGITNELLVTVPDLKISALSVVMASEAPGKDAPSELEERIMQAVAAKVASPTPTTEITLLETPPTGASANTIGLGAFRSLARWIYRLVTSQRPATASDLALPQDGNDEGLTSATLAVLAARADALAVSYGSVVTALDQLIASPPASADPLRTALWSAAALGITAAIPVAPPAVASSDDRDELLLQAKSIIADMHTAATRQATLVTSWGTGAGKSAHDTAAHHVDRIRALLGEHFPVLPPFAARNATDLSASIGDRAALVGGDDLAPMSWLQRMALVRSGVSNLSRVLIGAEMLQSAVAPSSMLVAQLPRAAGEKWLALPFGASVPEAELSVVVASSGAVNFSQPLAGLFCDGWSEVVPNRTETTGLAFHYDAPGARPPQAILLAAPPEPPNSAWTVNSILETVMEARRITPLRAVTPADLRWMGTMLPPVWLPAATSVDATPVNLDGHPPTSAPTTPAINALGKV